MKEEINKLKKDYDYLGLTEEQFDKIISLKNKIKNDKKFNFLINNIDNIILDSSNEFHNYLIDYLEINDQMIANNIIINFINKNIKNDDNVELCKKQLISLGNYLLENNYFVDIDNAISIINKNSILYNIIKNIIDNRDTLEKIKENNDNINVFLDAFCISQEIDLEIEDDENVEQELNNYMNLDIFKKYLSEIGSIPLLNKKEERELFVKVKQGDAEAKEKFILSNLRLVINIAKKYVSNRAELLDLIQDGNIGLMTAVDKFDETLGYKFSTYASWWIKQAIVRAKMNNYSTIRHPVHMEEKMKKIINTINMLKSNQMPATVENISKLTGFPVSTINKIKSSYLNVISLNATINEEDDDEIGDFIGGDYNTEEEALYTIETDYILSLLDELSDREKEVIIMRFGLYNQRYSTLDEIGKKLHLTRERIRQIEASALRKIRKSVRIDEMATYFEYRSSEFKKKQKKD